MNLFVIRFDNGKEEKHTYTGKYLKGIRRLQLKQKVAQDGAASTYYQQFEKIQYDSCIADDHAIVSKNALKKLTKKSTAIKATNSKLAI